MLWQEDTQIRNAQEMIRQSSELHGRLNTFIDHFTKVGSDLKRSVLSYNAAVGSFDSSVMPKAKAVEKLGRFTDELPVTETIEITVRDSKSLNELLPAAEISGSDERPEEILN